ncbi:MAG: tRNA pseudouridine(38-40) synthase TruA [Muribaculaceae bacterium]|nr:tRNA pseudouridine(38-40) synthase TruA [Muribaculaceae bacterium]
MRYAFEVQYIGKNYSGSQIQMQDGEELNLPTIQGELEKALSTLIRGSRCGAGVGSRERNEQGDTQYDRRCEGNVSDQSEQISDLSGGKATNKSRRIKTIFSGRTDKGVNSLGQVVHFDTEEMIVASKFLYQINEILPDDISVTNLKAVDSGFHAQKSAKKRYYRFEFINRRCKNAFDGDLMRVKFPTDEVRIQKSLNYLLGEHDFSSFKSAGTLNPSTICIIYEAKVSKVGDRVFIDIVGNRFLYNMVRTIVGTLLEIEGHNLEPEHMKDVLDAKDRRKAGMTVSPHGLTLMKVMY